MGLKFKKPSVKVLGTSKKGNPAEAVTAKRHTDDDHVQIAMVRTLEKPRVGHWKSEDALGKTKLKEGKSYFVPANVAQHFKDIKACVIVGQSDDDEEEDTEE